MVPRMASGRLLMRSASQRPSRTRFRGLRPAVPPDARFFAAADSFLLAATGTAAAASFFFMLGVWRAEKFGRGEFGVASARDGVEMGE